MNQITSDEYRFGIMLKNRKAVDGMFEFIKANDMADEISSKVIERVGELVSSPDENILNALLAQAEVMSQDKSCKLEVIRRLTLADLQNELSSVYDSCEIVSRDYRGRRHEFLVCKSGGDSVTVRSIIDQGIRSNARVLSVSMTPDNGEYVVTGYAIAQYETSESGVVENFDALVTFNVADFYKPESEADVRNALGRCRDAVVEAKATGLDGAEEWVAKRVKNAKGDKDAAFDEAQIALAKACESYGKTLYAVVMSSVKIVEAAFPLKRERSNSRRQQQERNFYTLGDRLAALKK